MTPPRERRRAPAAGDAPAGVGIVIVAHEPMASALYACGCHVFQGQNGVLIHDVSSDEEPEASEAAVRELIGDADTGCGVLVLTDVLGATPSNVAARAAAAARGGGHAVNLLAGANMAMLLRAISYRQTSLDEVTRQAMAGAKQAVLRVDDDVV